MGNKYIRHTDEEWLAIISECRSSGLTDKTWCQDHHITLSTFYYQINRLRKKACCIPEPVNAPVARVQEVVQLDLNLTNAYAVSASSAGSSVQTVSSSAEIAVRITFHGFQIEITNAAANDTVYQTLNALQQLC